MGARIVMFNLGEVANVDKWVVLEVISIAHRHVIRRLPTSGTLKVIVS